MNNHRPEDAYVKLPALAHATRLGYEYVSIKNMEPDVQYDSSTNIFYEPFRESIARLNNKEITIDKAKTLIAEISNKLSGDDLGREFFTILQTSLNGYKLFDFENPQNNKFQVVTELTYGDKNSDNFRPDITFLVNGMPLGFMEAKRPNNKEGVIAEQTRMHKRFKNPAYRKFANETQIMAFSNNQEYDDEERRPVEGSFYAASAYGHLAFNRFREEDHLYCENAVAPRNRETEKFIVEDNNLAALFGSSEWETSIDPTSPANRIITEIFSPERFLFFLKYGICYVEKVNDEGIKELQKHVMRYPQFFATKAVRKTLDSGQMNGVIWHTQGSGKTALSFFLTRYLRDYYQKQFRSTRFFFIVDRLDLANQAKEEFEARGATVTIANTRKDFAKLLKAPADATDSVSAGQPPVITVINIQRFDEDAQVEQYDYNLDVQLVYFIDEAHRDYKRGGAFLSNLLQSDRSAIRIALTGTPLLDTKGGNDTKQIFGPYIHKYFYNQSIADGYTLKLIREDIKTEFRLKMQEAMKDLQEIDKLVKIDEVMKHKKYVEPLVDYIVQDFQQSDVATGDINIGAMIVAHSSDQAREIYKRLSEVDQDFSCELILHDEGTKESRAEICNNFKKKDSNIDFLVVFNMLLTGFDAHRLKKLYLCRTIKAHNLLQALTRVNRPYKDMANGYVVDFADITEEYDKTNRAYLAELTEELGDATKEYSSLFESQDVMQADLARIKDILFSFSIDNIPEFVKEVNVIDNKDKLYVLRNALQRYKDLRNIARQLGYENMYDKFDIERAQELLHEVELRIQRINEKEALALADMSTGAVNIALDNIEFHFRRLSSDELSVSDEFHSKLKRTYGEAANNFDPGDPEYVNLLEELKKKFENVNIEELTSDDIKGYIDDLDALAGKFAELNNRNVQLAKKYGGDVKYARAHKEALRTPPPITQSQSELFSILNEVKTKTDDEVLSNSAIVTNESYFSDGILAKLKNACDENGLRPKLAQLKILGNYIARQYLDERGRAA